MLSFPGLFLKAGAAEEGGRRYLYLEASREGQDYQGETIAAKALEESAPYYLQYGNVDLDHVTQVGAARGIQNYPLFELGRPVDVRFQAQQTFVKAELYQGSSPSAESANLVWESLTRQRPAAHWYPSVAGQVLQRDQAVKAIIRKVRWTNIGLSKTPVNPLVAPASTVPIGILAKSFTASGGLAIDLSKGLEAGYGTDSATLTGGAALRAQSVDKRPQSYFDFRECMAGDLRNGRVTPARNHLLDHAQSHYGLAHDQAQHWVETFMADLADGLRKQRERLQ